jgi:vitamin B12 transporter
MKNFAVIGLALAPALAFAADPSTDNATQSAELQGAIVTATRTPVQESEALPQTIVIDRAQIERSQATDIGQILQQYAGLDVARNGGPGQLTSLFVRGGNSNYVVVLVDGVRINDGAFGSAPLSYISPEVIERIEVVEGPLSTLYGSDAVSGVINIITRKPGPNGLEAEVGGGSFNTVQGGGMLRGQGSLGGSNSWGAVLSGQQLHSGGIPAYTGATEDSEYRNRTLNGSAYVQLGGVKLEARAWDTDGQSPFLQAFYDCPYVNPVNGYSVCSQEFLDQVLALEASTHLTDRWYSTLTLSRSEDRLDSEGSGLLRTVRPEADWHNVYTIDDHNRASFGAFARREHVDTDPSYYGVSNARDSDYAYLQDEANYGRNHAVAAVNYLHDGAFGERFNWNVQYGYDLLRWTRLIATAGSAFRAPTAEDLYAPYYGNPDLQPEKAMDYELGLRQRFTEHQDAELRLFRTDVRDLIESPPPNYVAINVGHARLEGIQAQYRYRGDGWNARVDGIAQNPMDLDNQSELLRRARLSLGTTLERQIDRYTLGSSFYTAGRRNDVNAITDAPATDGGYGLWDVYAGARLGHGLSFDLRGSNILNHHYQTANGYNQAGSAVYATLRYALPL